MREWMFGNVDGWINPEGRRPRMLSFYEALGDTHSDKDYLYLYEDGKLVSVRNIKDYLIKFVHKHGRRHPSAFSSEDWHYHAYCMLDDNVLLREPTEKEPLVILGVEEKTNDQSD